MVTVQAPVPVHAPDQPANVEPPAAVGVSVTIVLAANVAEHEEPQKMPAGAEVTVPLPVPLRVTLSGNSTALNVAVTARAELIVTTQVGEVPVHAPDQPPNTLPPIGTAVSVTTAPTG
jgi:hypothetical protein